MGSEEHFHRLPDCHEALPQLPWVVGRRRATRPAPPPKGFQVVKRRWVVERTFGWIGRNRQLSKEYDTNSEHTVAWMYLAMTRLMLRRLTNNIDHGYNSRAEISKVVAK